MKKYLLDTNVFIQAKNRYYPKEIVPSFWQFLKQNEYVFTLKAVRDEINNGNDDLKDFIKSIKILPYTDVDSQKEVSEYITERYQIEEHKFLKGADYFLVCYAKDHGLTIVTEEKMVEDNSKKISIPNVCKKFDIPCINTFMMLKELKINLSNYKV